MNQVLEKVRPQSVVLLPRSVISLALDWSVELQLAASSYIADHRMEEASLLRVDVVLMLLRIGSAEARRHAQELCGRPITKCPSGVPPWPPKPPAAFPSAPRIRCLVPNPCTPSTDMFRRYGLIRVGMTRETMLARGCTERDIRYWTKNGHIEFDRGTRNGKA